MLEYREMNINDYENCMALWKKTEGMGFIESDTVESMVFYFERNPGMSFVCYHEESNALIGTILGGHDGRRGYIYHLAVDKSYRGNSIGSTLLNLTLEKMKEAGIVRCIIMLKTDNKENEIFWLKNGFDAREDLGPYSKDL